MRHDADVTWLDHLSAMRNYNRLVTQGDTVRRRRWQERRAEAQKWTRAAAENKGLREQLNELRGTPEDGSADGSPLMPHPLPTAEVDPS